MKILGKKASDYFPRSVQPLVRRIGLEVDRLRHSWWEGILYLRVRFGNGIRHVSGPPDFDFGPEHVITLCKFRNGEAWLGSFLNYYKRMGVDRIVLVDNGSTDGSREIVQSHEDVSLYETDLPHSRYWVPTKRWLIRNMGHEGCWCLMADIDELFDYPFSASVDVHEFIEYLNVNDYTAVSVQNLEMVADQPLMEIQGHRHEDLESNYLYYDISAITRSKEAYWLGMNTIDTSGHYSHGGGIRETGFGWGGSMLTRHALVRNEGGIKLYPYDSHFVTNANLADVTTLFRHYKFVSSFVDHMRDAIKHAQHHNNSRIFQRYARVLRERPGLKLTGAESKKYEKAEHLLKSGFLIASAKYRRWVDSAAARREKERTAAR